MNPTWSWCITCLSCWVLFASILLRIVASLLIKDMEPIVLLFLYGVYLSAFGIRACWLHRNYFGVFPGSSEKVWKNSLVNLSGWTWAFIFGKPLDYHFNFLNHDGFVPIFQIILVQSWDAKNLSIPSRFSFCGKKILKVISD